MQRLMMSLVLVILLLVAGLTAAPLFINLEAYKTQLISTVKAYTGLDAKVNGDISVAFLPTPVIQVSNVVVPSAEGAAIPNIITIDSIKISSSFSSIFQKKIDIKNIQLIHPVFEFETLSDGRSNSDLLKEAFLKRDSSVGESVPKNISIKNGTINYNQAEGKTTIDYVSSKIYADSINGPFSIDGDFSSGETVVKFEGEVGELKEGSSAEFKVSSDDFLFSMTGSYKSGDVGSIEGKVEGEIFKLSDFTKTFFQQGSVFAGINSQENFKINGDFITSKDITSFKNVSIASESIEGAFDMDALFSIKGSSTLRWEVTSHLKKIDIDNLVKIKEEPKAETGDKKNEQIDYYASSLKKTSLSDFRFDVSNTLSMLFDLRIDQIKYNNQSINDVDISTDIFNGNAIINSFSATLPGNSKLDFQGNIEHNGTRPLLRGNCKLYGNKLRDFVVWWLPDANFIPPDVMGEYTFDATLSVTPQVIDVSDFTFSFDKADISGTASIRPSTTIPSIKSDIKIERFNFDSYDFTRQMDKAINNFLINAAETKLETSWLKLYANKLTLSVDGKDLIYNDKPIDNLYAYVSLSQGIFDLQRIVLGAPAANVDGRVYVNIAAEKPYIKAMIKGANLDTALFLLDDENLLEKTAGKDAAAPEAQPKKPANDKWIWSDKPFNFYGIHRFGGNLDINLASLKYKDIDLANFDLEGELNKQVFSVNKLSADVLGGKMTIQGSAGFSPEAPSVGVSVILSNLDLNPLVNLFTKDADITGKVFFSGTARTFGDTPTKWMKELDLQGKIAGRGVTLKGIDFENIILKSKSLFSVIDMQGILNNAMNGITKFSAIDGAISADNSLLQTKDIKLSTTNSRGVFAGNMSLGNFEMNGVSKISYQPEAGKQVTIGLNLKGFPGNLDKKLDTVDLEKYITDKGKAR